MRPVPSHPLRLDLGLGEGTLRYFLFPVFCILYSTPMTIQFYTSNLPLPVVAQATVERKLNKLQRLARNLIKAQVDISRDRHHRQGEVYRVEINLTPSTGSILRGVAVASTVLVAADEVMSKIERQLQKKKDRPRSVRHIRE